MHVIVVKYVIVNKYFSAAHCLKQPIQTKQETNLNSFITTKRERTQTQGLRQAHVERGNAYTEALSSIALFGKRLSTRLYILFITQFLFLVLKVE